MNGKASDWLNITAKPSKELIIIPEAFDGTATFAPKKVVIRYVKSHDSTFKVFFNHQRFYFDGKKIKEPLENLQKMSG